MLNRRTNTELKNVITRDSSVDLLRIGVLLYHLPQMQTGTENCAPTDLFYSLINIRRVIHLNRVPDK